MNITSIKELERIASEYHLNNEVPDKFIEDICQEYCCNWLATLIDRNDRVAELGYGEGITLARLANNVNDYTLIEGAPSLAKLAKAKHPKVDVVQALFEEYQPRERFDKVLALHVLEHVDDPISLAKHLRTWLKPGGELVVIVPNKESLHRRLAVLMGLMPELDTLSPRDHIVGHQRVYDLAGLETELRMAGFEPFERRGFFLKVLPNGMMISYSPELLESLNVLGDQLPAAMQANLAVRARLVS